MSVNFDLFSYYSQQWFDSTCIALIFLKIVRKFQTNTKIYEKIKFCFAFLVLYSDVIEHSFKGKEQAFGIFFSKLQEIS